MPVQIGLVGLANLGTAQKRMSSMERAFELAPRRTLYEVGLLLRTALREEAPSKTGALRRSIGFRTMPVPFGAAAIFRANRTAIFVIGGTKPHEIWAGIFTGGDQGKMALSWPGARHPVTHVHHPGTKANDFRKKAWTRVRPAVRSLLREHGRAIFRGEALGADISL